MSRADAKLVAKLKKYSKEQIIEALANQFNGDYYIKGLLNHLEYEESDRLLKEHRKAIEVEAAARGEFSEFIKEAAAKYGDGKSFKISALPPAEYATGVLLEKAVKKSSKTKPKTQTHQLLYFLPYSH